MRGWSLAVVSSAVLGLAAGASLAAAGTSGSTDAANGVQPDGLAAESAPPIQIGSAENGWYVGGTVHGLQGTGLVAFNLGEDLPIGQDGPFQFQQPLPDGAIYPARTATQPSGPDQACSLANGDGTLSAADVNDLAVECVNVAPNPALDTTFGQGGKVTTPLGRATAEG